MFSERAIVQFRHLHAQQLRNGFYVNSRPSIKGYKGTRKQEGNVWVLCPSRWQTRR